MRTDTICQSEYGVTFTLMTDQSSALCFYANACHLGQQFLSFFLWCEACIWKCIIWQTSWFILKAFVWKRQGNCSSVSHSPVTSQTGLLWLCLLNSLVGPMGRCMSKQTHWTLRLRGSSGEKERSKEKKTSGCSPVSYINYAGWTQFKVSVFSR